MTSLSAETDPADRALEDRSAVVMVSIAGGVALPTQGNDSRHRAAAAELPANHPRLVTVAVAIADGGFYFGEYVGGGSVVETVHTGRELAAALTCIPLYGLDIRLWMGWPDGPQDRQRLDRNLAELAEVTGATVWTPSVGAGARPIGGCRDLIVGHPHAEARWVAYFPPGTDMNARFVSDLDGRLTPAGGPVVTSAGGVSLLSTPAAGDRALVDRYGSVWGPDGLLLVDLAGLEDGRLGVRYGDGSILALGGREARRLLREAGWVDEDICLLSDVPTDRTAGAREHLRALASDLGIDIYWRPPDTTLSTHEGLVRLVARDHRPATWLRTTGSGAAAPRWRDREGTLMAADAVTLLPPSPDPPLTRPHLPEPPRHHEETDEPVEPSTPTGSAWRPPPQPPPKTAVASSATEARIEIPPPSPRPAMVSLAPSIRPHGLSWLPDHLRVNAEAIQVYLLSPWTAEQVAAEGIPSAELFLLGRLDGEQLARSREGDYLLRLHVDFAGAVKAAAVWGSAPRELRTTMRSSDAYLIPAGWLDRARLHGGYALDESGAADEYTELNGKPVVLRCTDGQHGVDGLPNDVVPWPRIRAQRVFALLAGPPAEPLGDHLPLYRSQPSVLPGHRLVQLRLDSGAAIDARTSARFLMPAPLVRSRLGELVNAGVDLVLPRASYGHARVTRIFAAGHDDWHTIAGRVNLSLAALLSAPVA